MDFQTKQLPVDRDVVAPDGSDVRTFGNEPLAAVSVTMPPWPEDDNEAYEVEGKWKPTLA